MKFAYATMIILCLLTSTSWSASNPLIRNCTLAGGEFTVVKITKDTNIKYVAKNDQWALCKFDKAYVGAYDVMLFNAKHADPISFVEYTNNSVNCKGKFIEARVLQSNKKVKLCQYKDQSLVDFETLNTGPNNTINHKLNKYLGLIFN